MRKNKGFTLIELLAVIIILAIIAVISTPVIMDLINRSRYGAFSASKRNIERAAELYYARNAASIIWDNNISYVEIKTLKNKKYLAQNVVDVLTNMEIEDDTKILLYREGRKVSYSLQLYNEIFFDWYQGEMIKAVKKDNKNLPNNVGEKTTIDLNTLIDQKLVDELRLPLELENRCVGYVEIEKKTTKDYEYNAYVDCLTNASTFASHYVSYGGKYLDGFVKVIETSDGGYIAVGESNSETITKYGNAGNGKYDAIIVKFKSNGTVEWSQNFGGSNNDSFSGVTETTDGYVAVGYTSSTDGDIVDYKGDITDAIIVKYNKTGDVVYKRNYGSSGGNGNETFTRIIKVNDGYIVTGSVNLGARNGDLEGVVRPTASSDCVTIKFDNNFNTIWRSFFGGFSSEKFNDLKQTSDNGFIVVGHSASNDVDLVNIGWTGTVNEEAIIVKYDSNGNLQYKGSFRGSAHEYFREVIEVSDGYIAVGYSNSTDLDMTNLNLGTNGTTDAIIVKFSKDLSNIIWKKSFGGNNSDTFMGLIKENNNEYIALGRSKSEDQNMSGITISNEGYSNAILVKYNIDGNVISKKTFGGSNTDIFDTGIRNKDGNYIVAGQTFSSDIQLMNFNKGHSDALLVAFDSHFNLTKIFNESVVIIDKLKTIAPNYGTAISDKYNNLYTTNNPEIELGGWCSIGTIFNPATSYAYGQCLYPFNGDDLKQLTNGENTSNYKIVTAGEKEYTINQTPDNIYNWHRLSWFFGYSGGAVELSNLKLKFADGSVFSVKDAINNNYIEPLAVIANWLGTNNYHFFPTAIDIMNTGGRTGIGSYVVQYIHIKPKKSALKSVLFTADRTINTQHDGFSIVELRNFDMSITPTK